MASLYDIIALLKTLFESHGYTAYRIQDFDNQFVSRLDSTKFPAIFIGRQIEEINNDSSPTGFLIQSAGIDLNVVLNTGHDELESDASDELRKIKDIIYTNQNNQNWCNWIMIDNFVAQLANANDRAEVYGGININTTIEYRENREQGVL
jgi:hypothetical protein